MYLDAVPQQMLSVGIHPSVSQPWLSSDSELSSWTDVFSMPHISSSPRTPPPPRRGLLASHNLGQDFFGSHFNIPKVFAHHPENSLSPWEPVYSQRLLRAQTPTLTSPILSKTGPLKTVDKGLWSYTRDTYMVPHLPFRPPTPTTTQAFACGSRQVHWLREALSYQTDPTLLSHSYSISLLSNI